MNRSVGRIIGAALAAIGVGLGTAGTVAAPAGATVEPKVEICHATSSHSNPYRRIEVKVSSLDGVGNNDHSLHTGPVWFDGITESWGDIIPPPYGPGGLGVNWTDAGQEIFEGLDTCGAVECDPEEDEACEPACDPLTDPDQCLEPCGTGEERVEGVCTPVCQPTTANNQCTPCPQGQTPDGQGGCSASCVPTTANNQCTPCPEGQTADGQGGCSASCVPTTANNQCTPCPQGQTPDGQGGCATTVVIVEQPLVQPVIVPAAQPTADAVDCAGTGATPGIAVTLGNTGTADAVFTVLVNGIAVGDLATRTVTPAEAQATISVPQGEDAAATVVVEAEGLSVVVPLAGDCAQEVVLPVEFEVAPAAGPEVLPTEVEGVQHVRPARQALARTGSENQRLLVVAGLLLVLGGLSVYGSTLLAPADRD